jgi:4-amino-4-deoxychorismate lyase
MKFIESLRLEQGELRNLSLHQQRLDLTLLAHFGSSARIDLATELTHRALPAAGLYKIRVTYGHKIDSIEIDPYVRHPVDQTDLVLADGLDYRFKYADRTELDALRNYVARGVQPILVQRGLVTDAIYANVCLYDGQRWLTPAKPLLAGTARAAALAAGQISVAAISAEQVRKGKYPKLKLINCMTGFEEAGECPLTV